MKKKKNKNKFKRNPIKMIKNNINNNINKNINNNNSI